jgi:hypothetical protein
LNWRICTLAAVLAVAGGYQDAPPDNGFPYATVRGVVTDESSGPIANAELGFLKDLEETSVETASDGTYSVRLFPGNYTVRVVSPGFCDEHRGAFSARAGWEAKFNFTLRGAALADPNAVDADGNPLQHDEKKCSYHWEELTAPGGDRLKPMVLYGKREQEDTSVRYSIHDPVTQETSVVYMYDLLKIKATELLYSALDRSIVGTGKVVVQNGETTENGSRVDVTFPDGTPHVKLTK